MKRILLLAGIVSLCVAGTSIAQYKYWVPLNGPTGGYVYATVVDSTQRVVIGTGAAGIFTSTNKGDTWKPLNKGLRTLQIRRVEAGPDGYLYMYNHISEFARFHDIDVGWEYLNPWEVSEGYPVIHDVLINRRGTIFLAAYKQGVRRSVDHGMTWDYADTTLKGMTFRRLAVSFTHDSLYALDDSGYVYRSTNDGDSWVKASGRQPRPKILAECFEVSRGGDLIIASQRDIPGGKIYRSTDGGDSWSLVFEHPFDHVAYSLVRSDANGDMYASTHSPPDSKDQTYIGGIFRSTDNGATWVQRDDAEHGDDKFSMAVNKDGDIFHGSVPGGVELSSDRGFTWAEKNDGLLAHFLLGAAVNSRSHLFAITQFTMYRSTTGGDTWKEMNIEQIESFQQPIIRIFGSDVVYHGSYFGLYRSSDNGDHWQHVIEGDSTNNNFIYDLQLAPNGWIYAASEKTGLMVSKNDGMAWEKVPNLPPELRVTAIAFGINDTVLVATEIANCYYSANGGINWQPRQSSVSGAKTMVYHPSGTFVVQLPTEVMQSQDGGATWSKIFPTVALDTIRPSEWEMYSMLLDRKNNVLVSTDSGIWRSAYPFTDWEQIAFGITSSDYRTDYYTNVSQIVQDNQTGILYAASRGQSMYRSKNPDAGVKLSASVALASGQNYPNPFTDRTAIGISLAESGSGMLEVYTLLGERVLRESVGRLEAGKHSLEFDGSQLASGSYLYVLQLDGKPSAKGWMQIVR